MPEHWDVNRLKISLTLHSPLLLIPPLDQQRGILLFTKTDDAISSSDSVVNYSLFTSSPKFQENDNAPVFIRRSRSIEQSQ